MDSDRLLSFWDHIEELRWVLLRMVIVVVGATLLSFTFHAQVLALLTWPMRTLDETAASLVTQQVVRQRMTNFSQAAISYSLPPTARVIHSEQAKQQDDNSYQISPYGYLEIDIQAPSTSLVVLGPIDGVRTALSACFWFGLVAASPLWLYFLGQFLVPALNSTERRLIFPSVCLCTFFLLIGLGFAYYVAIPLANQFLYAFNGSIGQNLWSASLYLEYTVVLLLANALAFELCAALLLCVHYGAISARWLRAKRRYFYVAIFVVSALLTPPDVLTQLILALPLIGLFELNVVYASWRKGLDHRASIGTNRY